MAKLPEKMKDVVREARKFARNFRVSDGKKFRLDDFDPGETLGLGSEDRPRARKPWPPVSLPSPNCKECSTPRTGGPSC